MSARDKILARISVALQHNTPAAIDTHIAAHPRGPLPPRPDDLIATFKQRALLLSSDILQAHNLAAVPAMLAAYLKQRALPTHGVCWPALTSFNWSASDLDIQARPAHGKDLLGITGAFCAIAETGTLMMLSGPDTPASTSLLPETHVAILQTRRIVATMEDGWDLLRKEHQLPPRAINLISGPSRTADIEQTVTLGAHGPYRVVVILIDHI